MFGVCAGAVDEPRRGKIEIGIVTKETRCYPLFQTNLGPIFHEDG
jgi:hypothetical protein